MDDKFHAADYGVFGVTLGLSLAVGLYHAWKSRGVGGGGDGGDTTEMTKKNDFLMGGRKMPKLPVALSLMTTFISGFSLLGVPAEIYEKGVTMWLYQMMGVPALLLCALVFLPTFYRIRTISIYEYFQLRFQSIFLRRLAATLFLLNTLFYMAVVMYAPAVALSGVTGVPPWPFILSVGTVCTFYTTLGGLKAVVWTDTLQAVFMYAGVFSLIIKGTMNVGGVGKVFEMASIGQRLKPLTFIDPNPAQYFSIWIALFGGLSFWLSLYALNQMAVQRYCSLPSLRDAYIVIGVTIPIYAVLITCCCYIGLLMLAYFWDDDPLQGKVRTQDQLVIYFVVRTLGFAPGLPGLFLACLFSGTLSTVSSGINSMAAVMWEDYLKHFDRFRNYTDSQATNVSKILVGTFGVCAVGLAFAAEPMGGIIQAAISMMGSLAGPLVGLFFIGIVLPRTNTTGAVVGTLVAMAVTLCINLGSVITKPYRHLEIPLNSSSHNSSAFLNW